MIALKSGYDVTFAALQSLHIPTGARSAAIPQCSAVDRRLKRFIKKSFVLQLLSCCFRAFDAPSHHVRFDRFRSLPRLLNRFHHRLFAVDATFPTHRDSPLGALDSKLEIPLIYLGSLLRKLKIINFLLINAIIRPNIRLFS